jgi:hypothetical protein
MSTPQALASSPKTFLERDNWMRAILASDLPHVAVRVAMAIGFHLNVSTGQCNPSYAALSATSHVSERSLYRLVPLLERTGWIAIQRISGRLNHYTLLTPAKVVTGVTTARTMAGVPLPTRGGTTAKSEGSISVEQRRRNSGEQSQTLAPPIWLRGI